MLKDVEITKTSPSEAPARHSMLSAPSSWLPSAALRHQSSPGDNLGRVEGDQRGGTEDQDGESLNTCCSSARGRDDGWGCDRGP